MPELESTIERKLIEQLVYGESQWTYREDLKTEADLITEMNLFLTIWLLYLIMVNTCHL